MLYSYSPGLTWISICTLLSLTEVLGDANDVNSPFDKNDAANVFHSNGSISIGSYSTLDRNVRELQEIYLTREKKENEDPMNYLSKLYSDLEDSGRNAPFKMDDTVEAIVDPPQVDLEFHKKVPNCASEFNITKIIELVEDDKRQRKCPCSCEKGMDIYKGQGGASQLALTQVSSIRADSSANPTKSKPDLALKSPVSLIQKKVDDKTKVKTQIASQQRTSSPIQRLGPSVKLSDQKKTPLQQRPPAQNLRPVNSNIQAKNVNMKSAPVQMAGAKPQHKPTDLRQSKVGITGGKIINSKQPFMNSGWDVAEPLSAYPRLYQYKQI